MSHVPQIRFNEEMRIYREVQMAGRQKELKVRKVVKEYSRKQ